MSALMRTLAAIVLLGIASCNTPAAHKSKPIDTAIVAKPVSQTDTETKVAYQEPTPEETRQREEEERAEKLMNTAMLKQALRTAQKYIDKDTFSLETDSVDISYGRRFSNGRKYLVVTRHVSAVMTDIYQAHDRKFYKVLSKETGMLSYVGDTVCDVNGDGRTDYLFHWYPEAGCCERDIFDVFLQKPDGSFSGEKEFINPYFSPKQKTIIGRCYGRETVLYKYRWRDYGVDTLAFIYFPDSTNGNRYIQRRHRNETEKGKVLKELPREYREAGYGY